MAIVVPTVVEHSPLRLTVAIVPGIGLALCDGEGRILACQTRIEVSNEVGDLPCVIVTMGIDGETLSWAEGNA